MLTKYILIDKQSQGSVICQLIPRPTAERVFLILQAQTNFMITRKNNHSVLKPHTRRD